MKSDARVLSRPIGTQTYGDRGRGDEGRRPAGKARVGPEAPCVCCGEWGGIMARGLRERCYSRWRKNGRLGRWPLLRKQAVYELEREFAIQRAREYEALRIGPGGLSRKRACIVLDVTTRTAYRYEAWLRAEAEARR